MRRPWVYIPLTEQLVENRRENRRNVTFSLPKKLVIDFKNECDRNGIKMNQVVEKMIEEFAKK